MVAAAGRAAGALDHRPEHRRLARQACQAVAGRIAHRMGLQYLQILDRLRNRRDAAHLAVAIQRQHRRQILIRLARRDPHHFLVIRRDTQQPLGQRRMTVIQYNLLQVRQLVPLAAARPVGQTAASQPVGIRHPPVRQHMVRRQRHRVEDSILRRQPFRQRQIMLQHLLDRQQHHLQRHRRQIGLLGRHQRHNILQLAAEENRRRSRIAVLPVLHPHLRPENEERRLMLIGDRDARCADILLRQPRPFHLARRLLKKRQRVVLQRVALVVEQQQADAVHVEMALHLAVQFLKEIQRRAVPLAASRQLLPGKLHRRLERIAGNAPGPAAPPRLGHPRMDIGVDRTVIDEPPVILLQFFFAPPLTNHNVFALSFRYIF